MEDRPVIVSGGGYDETADMGSDRPGGLRRALRPIGPGTIQGGPGGDRPMIVSGVAGGANLLWSLAASIWPEAPLSPLTVRANVAAFYTQITNPQWRCGLALL